MTRGHAQQGLEVCRVPSLGRHERLRHACHRLPVALVEAVAGDDHWHVRPAFAQPPPASGALEGCPPEEHQGKGLDDRHGPLQTPPHGGQEGTQRLLRQPEDQRHLVSDAAAPDVCQHPIHLLDVVHPVDRSALDPVNRLQPELKADVQSLCSIEELRRDHLGPALEGQPAVIAPFNQRVEDLDRLGIGVEDRVQHGDLAHAVATEQADLLEDAGSRESAAPETGAGLAVLAERAPERATPLSLPADEALSVERNRSRKPRRRERLEVDHGLLAPILVPRVVDARDARTARIPGEGREGVLAVPAHERVDLRVQRLEPAPGVRDLWPAEDDPPGEAQPTQFGQHRPQDLLAPDVRVEGDVYVDRG